MNKPHPYEIAIIEALRQVIDPEVGCNLYDLGLIYRYGWEAGHAQVAMTLSSPGCPMQESLVEGVRNALLNIEGVTSAEVEVVWDPPWNPNMITPAGRAFLGVR